MRIIIITFSAQCRRLSMAWENRQWRYALNINNLTDEVYVASCLSRGDCWYGARRSVVASATYRF